MSVQQDWAEAGQRPEDELGMEAASRRAADMEQGLGRERNRSGYSVNQFTPEHPRYSHAGYDSAGTVPESMERAARMGGMEQGVDQGVNHFGYSVNRSGPEVPGYDHAGVMPEAAPVNGLSVGHDNPYIMQQGTGAGAAPASGSAGTDFLKGAAIGAAVTWLLTNERVHSALFKSVARLGGLFQGGVEELRERFEDAQAEVSSERMVDTE